MKYFRTKDSELIAKLNQHVHTIHYQLYPQYFKEYSFEAMVLFFSKFVAKKEHIFLIAEDNNQYVGYTWLELRANAENEFSKGFNDVYIHQISILEDFKGRGYGQKFMSKIYEVAKLYDIHEVKLDYWLGNDEAEKFYEKQGFVKIRQVVCKKLN